VKALFKGKAQLNDAQAIPRLRYLAIGSGWLSSSSRASYNLGHANLKHEGSQGQQQATDRHTVTERH
jgi:hypothetical protein